MLIEFVFQWVQDPRRFSLPPVDGHTQALINYSGFIFEGFDEVRQPFFLSRQML